MAQRARRASAAGAGSPPKKSRPQADRPTGSGLGPTHANAGANPVISTVCKPQSTCAPAPAGGSVEGLVRGAGVVLEVVSWSSAPMTPTLSPQVGSATRVAGCATGSARPLTKAPILRTGLSASTL